MILIYHTKQSLHLQNTTIYVHQSTTKKTGADSIKHFTSRTCILTFTFCLYAWKRYAYNIGFMAVQEHLNEHLIIKFGLALILIFRI